MMDILKSISELDEKTLDRIVEDATDFAFQKGFTVKAKSSVEDFRTHAPFCLLPSQFPERWFHKVKDLQNNLNYVLLRVAHSKEFLLEALSSTIKADEFVSNIFKIFQAVEKEQQLCLGLIRSDYLLNTDCNGRVTGIKQVENNTIASSFGGLAPIVTDIHEFVLNSLGQEGYINKLLSNESVHMLARGLVSAWDTYDTYNAIVLFVVEEVTSNISDQRALEYAMYEYENKLKVVRCSFKELRSCLEMKGKTLFVHGKEVAVVYYRVGYMPDHYELVDWETRLLIERSKAIKCPSAGLHLAGTKKVQLYLNKPGVLERFVDASIAAKLREVFVGQYTLDKDRNADIINQAIQNPENFVLKPEREGGGNNLYDDDLKNFLIKDDSSNWDGYILMERINPPHVPNCIVRSGSKPVINSVVCELGIYGTILGNAQEVHVNNLAGHLLRSKEASVKECGIVAGFGALDSPCFE